MRLSRKAVVAATMLLATAGSPMALVDDRLVPWRPGSAGDLAFETGAFLKTTAYAKLDNAADRSTRAGNRVEAITG